MTSIDIWSAVDSGITFVAHRAVECVTVMECDIKRSDLI